MLVLGENELLLFCGHASPHSEMAGAAGLEPATLSFEG